MYAEIPAIFSKNFLNFNIYIIQLQLIVLFAYLYKMLIT